MVSISNSRVYYLDGNADVRSLGPDGSTALATHLPGSASVSVGFAISPDDRRIAVSVIEYTDSFQAPVKLRMYVEDLVGGRQSRRSLFLDIRNRVAYWLARGQAIDSGRTTH